MSSAALQPQDDDRLNNGLLVSLCAHGSVVLILLLKSLIFSSDIQAPSSIRVDLVALPDKNQALPVPGEAAKPEPTVAPPAQEKAAPEPAKTDPKILPPKVQPKTDAINLNKTKANEKAAFDKLKSMQAFEKIKQEVSQEKSERELRQLETLAAEARAKAGKIKGNIIAHGTDLTGVDKLEHEEYRNTLDHHIKPYWRLPEWMAHRGLKARALVKVNGQGRLVSKQIVRTSGNTDFDQSVLDTIDSAAPFPLPPEKLVELVSGEGILIDFGEQGASR